MATRSGAVRRGATWRGAAQGGLGQRGGRVGGSQAVRHALSGLEAYEAASNQSVQNSMLRD